MIKVKTFIKAFEFFETDLKELKAFLSDKRLGLTEKKIIEACIMLKESRNTDAIDHISNLKPEDPVVESYQHFVLGWSYNGIGHTTMSKNAYHKALELIKPYDHKSYEFLVNYYLFFVYRNHKDFEGIKRFVTFFDDFEPKNVKEQGGKLRCLYSYYVFMNQLDHAERFLKQLEKIEHELHPSARLNFLIDKFDFNIKREDFKKCRDIIEEIKKFRSFRHKTNFKFMVILLDHLMDGKVIYAYEADFKEIPLLYSQIQVIKSLEEGNMSEAHFYWSKLSDFENKIYGQDFNYQGDKCLFSLCLQKHRDTLNSGTVDVRNLPENKMDAVLFILNQSTVPVRQEWIYEMIWKDSNPSKLDLNNRLASLVARIRKEKNLDITYRKGCYLLVSDKSKAG